MIWLTVAISFMLSGMAHAKKNTKKAPVSVVKLITSKGDITIKLFRKKAPVTTRNFLQYARSGFYNGTIFHRVMKNFMIQGGGMTRDMTTKKTRGTIRNEANNGLQNNKGTLAMARTSAPHSASAQFFINHADNHFLDHRNKSARGWGYCVFGKVIKGMKVVEAIAQVLVTTRKGHRNVPVSPIVIKKVQIIR
jgi:peptidyl-prolyl cis-trans isomerase B (cyclophilin B)